MALGSRVDLAVFRNDAPKLCIAPDLAASLNLGTAPSPMMLHFGQRSLAVTVTPNASLAPGTAELPLRAARALRLPKLPSLNLYRTGRHHLRLGPLLGVFISEAKLSYLLDGQDDSVYLRLTRYAEEAGICLVFVTASGIRVRDMTANAYCYRAGNFEPIRVALPRVLYDRCFGPGSRADAYWLRNLAKDTGITVINDPVKLSKMSTASEVASDPALRPNVPYFQPLTAESLVEAAKRFDVLYLKPDNLSKGRGVCRVQRAGDAWLLEQSGPDGPIQHKFASPEDVIRHLPSTSPYLVQEALDLASYMGNRYDFRALVQKNGSGDWQLTGLVARIAPANGVVTSPRSGGLVAPAPRVLEYSFGPDTGRQMLYDLTRTCLRIAARLEEAYGLFAEIGLDMGVTQSGHIVLIEANSRPLKVSLNRLCDPAISGPIIRQPLNFGAFVDLGEDVGELE